MSRYGDTTTPEPIEGRPFLKTGGHVADGGVFWSIVYECAGWRLEQHRIDRHLRVLDPSGIRRPHRSQDLETLKRVIAVWIDADAQLLRRRTDLGAGLDHHLKVDPDNTNLRLLQVRRMLDRLRPRPDWLLITGDLTDNGYGYDFLGWALEPWFRAGKVIVVPGNHDLNKTMISPFGVQLHMEPDTTTRRDKERRFWHWYTDALGLGGFPGSISRPIMVGDALACVGVDSVKDVSGQIAFEATRNAVGHIPRGSLEHLEDTLYALTRDHPRRAVIIALHHQVLWKGMAPPSTWESLMSIDNADEFWEIIRRNHVHLVVSGHRHLGYARADLGPRYPVVVSSPSATLGDERGDRGRYLFVVDHDVESGFEIERVDLPAVAEGC